MVRMATRTDASTNIFDVLLTGEPVVEVLIRLEVRIRIRVQLRANIGGPLPKRELLLFALELTRSGFADGFRDADALRLASLRTRASVSGSRT
jgi:hypothetical protein